MHADGKPDGMPNNKGCSFSTEKAKKVDPRPIDLTLLLLFYTHTHLRTIALAKSLVISNDFRLDLVSPIYTKKRSYFFFSVLKTRFLFFFFFPKARTPFFFWSQPAANPKDPRYTIHRNLDAIARESRNKFRKDRSPIDLSNVCNIFER